VGSGGKPVTAGVGVTRRLQLMDRVCAFRFDTG
jgi:hypothetical protein